MNTKLKDTGVEFLFEAILALETKEECYNFFEDLCTVPELKAMSQRLAVAKITQLITLNMLSASRVRLQVLLQFTVLQLKILHRWLLMKSTKLAV